MKQQLNLSRLDTNSRLFTNFHQLRLTANSNPPQFSKIIDQLKIMAFSGSQTSLQQSVLDDLSQKKVDQLGVLRAFPAPKVPLIEPVKPINTESTFASNNQ